MSLPGVGANSSTNNLYLLQQRRQSLQAMESAVAGGDMAGAQQALGTLQSLTVGGGTGVQPSSTGQNSLLQMDLSALGDASAGSSTADAGTAAAADDAPTAAADQAFLSLITAVQSGDATDAQSALSTLQQDIGNSASPAQVGGASGHRHHHHHAGGSASSATAASTEDALFAPDEAEASSASATSAADSPDDVLLSLLNTTNQLGQS